MVHSRSLSKMGLDFVYLPMINKDRPITGLKLDSYMPSYSRFGQSSRLSRSLDLGECRHLLLHIVFKSGFEYSLIVSLFVNYSNFVFYYKHLNHGSIH